ncbi:gluconate 2-dehydrogenase subunit 3 family protein [Daejeonella sp.]|jgi:hypothetical protein|uniref:gluconate 2-dehydrogenase subunit 3 family protein n=1 Tax=Daejeonella sp. TaxID=2805397 RepID=UPI003784217D
MNRREAVGRAAFLLGGAITFNSLGAFAEGVMPANNLPFDAKLLNAEEDLVAEIADTFIPDRKDIPGAKAAGLGPFIVMMIQDCYTSDIQMQFAKGLKTIEEVSQTQFQRSFKVLTLPERENIFKLFKAEAIAQKKNRSTSNGAVAPPHFFQLVSELTYLGYYTSEIGATKALRYVHIPGKYQSCVPLQAGQKAWAT